MTASPSPGRVASSPATATASSAAVRHFCGSARFSSGTETIGVLQHTAGSTQPVRYRPVLSDDGVRTRGQGVGRVVDQVRELPEPALPCAHAVVAGCDGLTVLVSLR